MNGNYELEKCLENMINQGLLGNKALVHIIHNTWNLNVPAATQLLKQNPNEDELMEILDTHLFSLHDKVSEKILEQGASQKGLFFILLSNNKYKKRVWEDLCSQRIKNEYLEQIIQAFPEYRSEAGKRLLGQNPSNSELRCIIKHVKELCAQAGKKLLEQNTNNIELRLIIELVEELRPKAIEKLQEQNPKKVDLQCIEKYKGQ